MNYYHQELFSTPIFDKNTYFVVADLANMVWPQKAEDLWFVIIIVWAYIKHESCEERWNATQKHTDKSLLGIDWLPDGLSEIRQPKDLLIPQQPSFWSALPRQSCKGRHRFPKDRLRTIMSLFLNTEGAGLLQKPSSCKKTEWVWCMCLLLTSHHTHQALDCVRKWCSALRSRFSAPGANSVLALGPEQMLIINPQKRSCPRSRSGA